MHQYRDIFSIVFGVETKRKINIFLYTYIGLLKRDKSKYVLFFSKKFQKFDREKEL